MTEFFNGLRVPEGPGRRELYRSQFRMTFAYKMQLGALTQGFHEILQQDQWGVKEDDRIDGVGTLTIYKGQETVMVSFEEYPEPNICAIKYFLPTRAYSKSTPPMASPMRR